MWPSTPIATPISASMVSLQGKTENVDILSPVIYIVTRYVLKYVRLAVLSYLPVFVLSDKKQYGMVWYGMVCYDMVWYGIIYSMVWHGLV